MSYPLFSNVFRVHTGLCTCPQLRRRGFFAAFTGIGAFCIVANYGCLAQQIIYKRFVSLVPLVGPIFATAGLFFCPIPEVRAWWFVPWLVDPGTWMLIAALPMLIRGAPKRRK